MRLFCQPAGLSTDGRQRIPHHLHSAPGGHFAAPPFFLGRAAADRIGFLGNRVHRGERRLARGFLELLAGAEIRTCVPGDAAPRSFLFRVGGEFLRRGFGPRRHAGTSLGLYRSQLRARITRRLPGILRYCGGGLVSGDDLSDRFVQCPVGG